MEHAEVVVEGGIHEENPDEGRAPEEHVADVLDALQHGLLSEQTDSPDQAHQGEN